MAAPARTARTSNRRITVTPFAGALGAEISGVDLRHVDDETFAEIYDAWLDHLAAGPAAPLLTRIKAPL